MGQHNCTRMAYFTSRLALTRMVHTIGGSWNKIPFQRNTGEELQHEGEYLSWVPSPRGNRPLVMPPAVLRHTLFYRELTWMGVSFGASNTHSWHFGDLTTPFASPPHDNNSKPGPTGPGWQDGDSYTRCNYGADGDVTTYHTGLGPSGGSSGTSRKLRTPYCGAAYGLRASPQQSSAAAERAARATSTQLRAQMASAFALLDVKDAFISVTVARSERAPTPPPELSAYARRIVSMHPPPLPAA